MRIDISCNVELHHRHRQHVLLHPDDNRLRALAYLLRSQDGDQRGREVCRVAHSTFSPLWVRHAGPGGALHVAILLSPNALMQSKYSSKCAVSTWHMHHHSPLTTKLTHTNTRQTLSTKYCSVLFVPDVPTLVHFYWYSDIWTLLLSLSFLACCFALFILIANRLTLASFLFFLRCFMSHYI